MKNLKLPVFLFIALSFAAPLTAQTAAKLESLLETPVLSWEEAAAFVMEAAEIETMPGGHNKWLQKKFIPGGDARLDGIALLLMESFELKGGIFYSIAKSPHHAYRELVYKNVIGGNSDPDMRVSGPQLLTMLSRILAMKEQP